MGQGQQQQTSAATGTATDVAPAPAPADAQSLYGNAYLQEALLCSNSGSPEAGVDTEGDADELSGASDPQLAAFLADTFAAEDNVPSTGSGCFDAAYDPKSGVLTIGLRLGVIFDLPFDATWKERAEAWWNETDGWTPQEKQAWLANLESSVEAAWATDQLIRCTRPGWCLAARPILDLSVSEGAGGHYDVTVHKSAGMGSDFRPGVTEGWTAGGTAEMEEDHTKVGLDSQAVQDAAIEQVEGFTDPPLEFEVGPDGEVRYAPGQEARVTAAATDLGRLPPGTPRLRQVWVEGWDGDDPASVAAEELVVAAMPKAPHEFSSMYWGKNDKGLVTFKVNAHPDAIEYDNRFEYAAHEVGHMLGLPDEYEDHDDASAEAQHDVLIEAAGAEQVMRDADTSSIMSMGGDVLPAHLVTMWEALTRMTSEYLEPSEWQL